MIAVKIRPETETRVRDLAAAEGMSPEDFLATLIEEDLSEKYAAQVGSTVEEGDLLLQINRGLTEGQWQRYHQLRAKLEAATLSEGEHQELLQLSDYREMQNAKRLEALAQLARQRGISLRALMLELELLPIQYE
jgi:predicted DNA binding CopG/RHH family protein